MPTCNVRWRAGSRAGSSCARPNWSTSWSRLPVMSARVGIVTDSTACLDPADAEREGIVVVPLKVVIGEETFVEGCGLTGDRIAEALRAKKQVTTSRPTPEEFLEAYEKLAGDGIEEIVSVHLSSKVSGTL